MSNENLTIYTPFKGVLPNTAFASEIIAPPYDVLSSAEAKIKAKNKPNNFLHVSKAEIDLPDGTDEYAQIVYDKAGENFRNMLKTGMLKQHDKNAYYIYQLTMGKHVQTGLVVGASVKAYDEGRIKKHEFTRVVKEDDRVNQIKAVGAQTGPVLLINKNIPEIKQLIKEETSARKPLFSVVGDYDVIHSLWIVDAPEKVALITEKFAKQNCAYIADGHHRSAAASRVAQAKGGNGLNDWDSFLAVTFFEDEMKILDYNRITKDLNGLSKAELIAKISKKFEVSEISGQYIPEHKETFGMYLDSKWYKLTYKDALPSDPVQALDVSLLSDNVLIPILGIGDFRKDERIDFVGGIRGASELEKRVNSGEMKVAFSLFPTSVQELMDVANNNQIMPPKSTWFEPKLADGVTSKMI